MQILKEKEVLGQLIEDHKKSGLDIGLVPTMGALHQGHISLINHGLASCDKIVVSIFVNPTQFENPSDLQKYPRTLKKDISLLSKLNEEIIVFTPNPWEIYGDEVVSQHFSFDGLEHEMEGKYRKGHFDGVGTVVKRLLEIVKPDKAFFGEKDFQQLQIIKKLVEKNRLDVEVIGCPVEREPSGLALSSRNERLSSSEREQAAFIYQILLKVKEGFGTKNAAELNSWVEKKFNEQPALKLEYFNIAETDSLKAIGKKEKEKKYRAFIAAYIGDIRLIDNIALN